MPYNPDEPKSDDLKVIERFDQRIRIKGNPEMDILGNAVHAYFAVDYERLLDEDHADITKIILKNWGIENSIDHIELMNAGQRLTDFMASHYEGYKAYKEWPISLRNDDGQVIQGWIDLLLDTPNGYVIIDHKDYPGTDAHERMRIYIPQLNMYKKIIEKATKRPVVDTLLHLPISGLILKLEQI